MSPRYKLRSSMHSGFNNAGQFGIKPTAAIPKQVLEEKEIDARRKIREERKIADEASGIFRCPTCKKIFNTKVKLLGHIRFAHQRDDFKKDTKEKPAEAVNVPVDKEINKEVGEIKT